MFKSEFCSYMSSYSIEQLGYLAGNLLCAYFVLGGKLVVSEVLLNSKNKFIEESIRSRSRFLLVEMTPGAPLKLSQLELRKVEIYFYLM